MEEPGRTTTAGPESAQPFALWLLPAAASGLPLQRCIEGLAHRHGAPLFVPHLTLCSGHGPAGATDPLVAAEALARRWCPLQFPVKGLAWGGDFFTFLFLRLGEPPGGSVVQEALVVLPGCQGPPVGPHLSLLYADPAPGAPGAAIDRADLVRELAPQLEPLLTGSITFDRLAVVRPEAGGWRHGWPWRQEGLVELCAAGAVDSPRRLPKG